MKRVIFPALLLAAAWSCKKDEDPFARDEVKEPVVINPADTLDPNSFVALHNNVFRPTCANSGCHDGTFEPDYRTIESSYNTLVLQPVIKNSPDGRFKYRVKPGDAENSVLYHRLHTDIDGQSGTMPIAVDPNSDWPAKKTQYIENIKNWINNGAKDMFGNAPTAGNLEPVFNGVTAFADNSTTALARGAGKSSIVVPVNAQTLDLWFSFSDDDTQPGQLKYNKIKISDEGFQFQDKPESNLIISPARSAAGYFDTPVSYTHKITLNLSQYKANQIYYFRAYVQDSNAQPTEIPRSGSANYIKLYFSFIRK